GFGKRVEARLGREAGEPVEIVGHRRSVCEVTLTIARRGRRARATGIAGATRHASAAPLRLGSIWAREVRCHVTGTDSPPSGQGRFVTPPREHVVEPGHTWFQS